MLKQAGTIAREIFQDNLFDPVCSPQLDRRVDAVVPIRERRESATQELSFARPFILCGLPIRRLPAGTLSYNRRKWRIFPGDRWPSGVRRAVRPTRLILLWLATDAVRNRSPAVAFESVAQILNQWGLPTNREYYRRLAAAFKRVFASTIFFGRRDERRGAEVWNCSRVQFFDNVRLWFSKQGGTEQGSLGNLVTLSAPFWEELRTHPIPVDADLVRVLANNPGCPDLYTWLTWRCFQAKSTDRIPLFGAFGLAAQLGVQEYARERKFREGMKEWLKLVRLYWPECPAVVSFDGRSLELKHGAAIAGR